MFNGDDRGWIIGKPRSDERGALAKLSDVFSHGHPVRMRNMIS
jgi:hypothetical protein